MIWNKWKNVALEAIERLENLQNQHDRVNRWFWKQLEINKSLENEKNILLENNRELDIALKKSTELLDKVLKLAEK